MLEQHTVPPPTMLSQGGLSEEQRDKHRRTEILKNWRIQIQSLDRGCTVLVGCKSFAFENIDDAMETVKQYIDNPVAVIKRYGFENYL